MSKPANFFARPATENEIQAFKNAITMWGSKQAGKVDDKLGENIKVKECTCGQMAQFHFDLLVEERSRDEVKEPSSKRNAPSDAKIKFGVVDLWSFPTPDSYMKSFSPGQGVFRIEETAYYVMCNGCKEAGIVDCPTCKANGTVPCTSCGAKGGYNCRTCNGHGRFVCGECDDARRVEYKCSHCDTWGQVACNACKGSGLRFNPDGKDFPCHFCNASGKERCGACHGSAKVMDTCRKCHGRDIICSNCRGQVWLTCTECRGNTHVNCKTCKTLKNVDCPECNKQGGHKRTEVIKMKTSIHTSQVFLSPVENIREHVSAVGVNHHFAPEISLSKVDELCAEPVLRPYAHDLVNSVKQSKPNSTLLEQFQFLRNSFLEMKFEYDGKEFLAYADFRNEDAQRLGGSDTAIRFKTNPLAGKIDSVKQKLQNQAKEAREKRDPKALKQFAERAAELGFGELASSWKSEAKTISETLEKETTERFVNGVKNPVTLVTPTLIWLVAGFLMPVGLHFLIIWNAGAYYIHRGSSKDMTKLEKQKADFKGNMILIVGGILVTLAISYAISYMTGTAAVNDAFKSGIEL